MTQDKLKDKVKEYEDDESIGQEESKKELEALRKRGSLK